MSRKRLCIRNKTYLLGTIKLPSDVSTACAIMNNIFIFLGVKSLASVMNSSLIKQLCTVYRSFDFVRLVKSGMASERNLPIKFCDYANTYHSVT